MMLIEEVPIVIGSICLSCAFGKLLHDNYVLTREFLQKDKITILTPETLDLKRYNLKIKLTNPSLREETEIVNSIALHLKKSLPHVNLSFMSRNLETLRLTKRPNLDLYNKINKSKTLAYYSNNEENRIVFINDEELPHELFHVSTATKDKERWYSGFHQTLKINPSILIGKGINEGYTNLLCERYFNKETKTYQIEKKIVPIIEILVGKEDMEKLYFTADLSGLIQRLCLYDKEKNIIKFIRSMDFICNHTSSKEYIGFLEYEYIMIKLNYVFNKLMEYYFKKLKMDFDNNIINDIELVLLIKEFLSNSNFIISLVFKTFKKRINKEIYIKEQLVKERLAAVFNCEELDDIKMTDLQKRKNMI